MLCFPILRGNKCFLHEMMRKEVGGREGEANAPLPLFFLPSPVLWTYHEHMIHLWIWFKNPKRIMIVFSRHLIYSIIVISQTFFLLIISVML